jgi:hypothetical protein
VTGVQTCALPISIETAWRECDVRRCGTRDRGGMLEAICALRRQLGHVSMVWIPAHRGSSVSAYADALAKAHLNAPAVEDAIRVVGPLVTSKPSLPTFDSDYDEDGKIVRSDEDGVGRVLMDRRMFGVGKVRMSRWVHAELARTLSADSGLLIDRSFIGRRGHKLEARSWAELAKAFLRSGRLDRDEDDPVTRLTHDNARTGVVMRARVGAHLGVKGSHDRTWGWRYADEQRRGVAGAATRHGVAGCPCCVRPDDDAAVCRSTPHCRDATAREVNMREGREGRREWLRLVVRAWREQADNRRAGAAQWETRWREGRVGVLSRREVSGVEWTLGSTPHWYWSTRDSYAGGSSRRRAGRRARASALRRLQRGSRTV